MKHFLSIIFLLTATFVQPVLCQNSNWTDDFFGWLPEGPYRMLQFIDAGSAFESSFALAHPELLKGISPYVSLEDYFGSEVGGNVKAILVADFFQEVKSEEVSHVRFPFEDVYFGVIRSDSVEQLIASLKNRFTHASLDAADGAITLDKIDSDVPFPFTMKIKTVFLYPVDAEILLFAESPRYIEDMLKAHEGELKSVLKSEQYDRITAVVPQAYYWTILPNAPLAWFTAERFGKEDPEKVAQIREGASRGLLYRIAYRKLTEGGFTIFDTALYADESGAQQGFAFPMPAPYPANGSEDIEKYNNEIEKRTKVSVEGALRIRTITYDPAFIELEEKVQALNAQKLKK